MDDRTNKEWQNLVKKQQSHSEIDNEITYPEQISSYIFIYDCFENSILYVNKAFSTITGYEEEDLNLDFLISMIHPDDVPYFLNCEEKGLTFTNQLSFNEHFKYILSYSYRIRTRTGEYIPILQQCQALEVNNSGHLTKTLVIHKRLDDQENVSYKIFDKTQNIYIDQENSYYLSKRELQILHLIKEGMDSQQVSDHLKISKHTVLTHRKNILNKTKTKSFIKLIKKISINQFE